MYRDKITGCIAGFNLAMALVSALIFLNGDSPYSIIIALFDMFLFILLMFFV